MVLEVLEVVVHRESFWYIGHLFGTSGQRVSPPLRRAPPSCSKRFETSGLAMRGAPNALKEVILAIRDAPHALKHLIWRSEVRQTL